MKLTMADDYVRTFSSVTPTLLKYGWLFAPKMLGAECRALQAACTELETLTERGTDLELKAEKRLADVLVFNAFHPNYRAYYVWLAKQQPHLQAFSHLIETAAHHYFTRDYISTVHCLLPVIEGTLRAHHHAIHPNFAGRLRYDVLAGFLRSKRPVHSYPEWHAMYRDALADFLDKWLWHPTPDADWSLSYLNRHYALHGLGTEHYYRALDCHRLFLFIDLYVELLVLETQIGEYQEIPAEPGIERRRAYYEKLMLASGVTRFWSTRQSLLREHPHFHEEPPGESTLHRLMRWAKIMGLDRGPG